MQNAGMDEVQAGIKIFRRTINNLRYADDTTLMCIGTHLPAGEMLTAGECSPGWLHWGGVGILPHSRPFPFP